MPLNLLAFDLGASSGRLIEGAFDGERIELRELWRFPNEPVRVNGRYYWDTFRLVHEIKNGLARAASSGAEFASLGVDTWGVDYGLLDKDDNLIGTPITYRDSRTDGAVEALSRKIPLREVYASTGIQFMDFNTLFQLMSDKNIRSGVLERAQSLLFMPDLLNFFLTGEKRNEYTIASTSQMLNAASRDWDHELLRRLELPTELFCDMIKPGGIIGALNAEIRAETGAGAISVVAVGSHDTASAVAGTPFYGKDAAFLSCGTWSLLGVELDEPNLTEAAFRHNFTNEGGVCDTIRFLKNINGLWIIQQLRNGINDRSDKKISFGDIIDAAKSARNKEFIIDPADSAFMAPLDMSAAIADYCEGHGQGKPEGLGETAMAVYNGLTGEYKTAVDSLESITGRSLSAINMIGGGIQDGFLCAMTAAKTGKTVLAGPVEGSVLGNILMQLIALGEISGLDEGRDIVRRSFEQKIYPSA